VSSEAFITSFKLVAKVVITIAPSAAICDTALLIPEAAQEKRGDITIAGENIRSGMVH
jgi:hypothetical protein